MLHKIAIIAQCASKQVSSLQKIITFTLNLKWRPKLPIWKDYEVPKNFNLQHKI